MRCRNSVDEFRNRSGSYVFFPETAVKCYLAAALALSFTEVSDAMYVILLRFWFKKQKQLLLA